MAKHWESDTPLGRQIDVLWRLANVGMATLSPVTDMLHETSLHEQDIIMGAQADAMAAVERATTVFHDLADVLHRGLHDDDAANAHNLYALQRWLSFAAHAAQHLPLWEHAMRLHAAVHSALTSAGRRVALLKELAKAGLRDRPGHPALPCPPGA